MVLSKEWNAYKVGFGTRTNAQFTKIPEILNSYPILKDVSFIKSVEWGTSLMWLLFETTTLSLPSRMTDHQSLRLLVALLALGTEMKLLFDLFVSESSLWTVKILQKNWNVDQVLEFDLAENALPLLATVSFLIFDGSEKCRCHIAVFIREKLELVMAFTPKHLHEMHIRLKI